MYNIKSLKCITILKELKEKPMSQLFINQKNQKKLNIVKELLTSNGATDIILKKKFSFTRSSFTRYINELEEDFSVVFQNKVSIKTDSQGVIVVLTPPDLTKKYIIGVLRHYYIESSPLYALIKALLTKKYDSVLQLSHDLNYSEPAVYKLLSNVQEILKPFGAQVDFSEVTNFSGNELGVRYFLYLMYLQIFGEIEHVPFPTRIPPEFIDISFLKKQLNITRELSHTQARKLEIISAITCYRLVFYNKELNIDEEFFKNILPLSNVKTSLNLSKYNVSEHILERESVFFQFFVRGLIFDIDTFSSREKIVERYKSSNLTINTDISSFLNSFKQDFQIQYSDENYVESYYLVLMTYLYIQYFSFEIDNTLSYPVYKRMEHFKQTRRYSQLLPIIKKQMDNLNFKGKLNSTQRDVLLLVFYTLYEINRITSPITLYINYSADISTALYIKNKLKQFFNPSLISFCEIPEQADIIISNRFEGKNFTHCTFYLENIFDEEAWQRLIMYLSESLIKSNHI